MTRVPLTQRQSLIDLISAGLSKSAAARRLGLNQSTAYDIVVRWQRTGRVAPDSRGDRVVRMRDNPASTINPAGAKKAKLSAHLDWLCNQVARQPTITLHELKTLLARKGVQVSREAINKRLRALGFKKAPLHS